MQQLNVLLQLLTLAELADPYFLRGAVLGFGSADTFRVMRLSTEQSFKAPDYACRLDQVGLTMLQIVLTEFVFGKVVKVCMRAQSRGDRACVWVCASLLGRALRVVF